LQPGLELRIVLLDGCLKPIDGFLKPLDDLKKVLLDDWRLVNIMKVKP
jgi:hypothetical protein